MKKYLKNLHCAPRSTILALIIFCVLTWLRVAKVLDNEVYNPLAPLVLGFAFTDILGEKGKQKAKKLIEPAESEEHE